MTEVRKGRQHLLCLIRHLRGWLQMGNSLFFLMVILVSFNCNGIHDTKKWTPLWNLLKSTRADLIVLQETYLTEQQVYTFSLYA